MNIKIILQLIGFAGMVIFLIAALLTEDEVNNKLFASLGIIAIGIVMKLMPIQEKEDENTPNFS